MSLNESWLKWPTLVGGEDVAVVGESRHQEALERIAGGRTPAGPRIRLVTASLVCEPNNPFDSNAVRVDVDGNKVAYIPRTEAPRFGAAIRDLGIPATCRARVTGGFETRGEKAHLGLTLDLRWPLTKVTSEDPFLPRGRSVAVVGEENAQATLAALGEISVIATLVPQASKSADPPFLMVNIGIHQVGMFSPAHTARFSRMVLAARDAGFPTTCAATISRGKAKFEVVLSLGTPYESDT